MLNGLNPVQPTSTGLGAVWNSKMRKIQDLLPGAQSEKSSDNMNLNRCKAKVWYKCYKRVGEISSSWRIWGLMEKMISELDEGQNYDKFKENILF